MKLILLILLSVSVAHASPNAHGELRDLLEAKSLIDLETREKSASRRRATYEACTAELRAHLLPRACFHELEKTAAEESDRRQRLANICVQNAKASQSRLDLSGSTSELPDECRKAALERLGDLQYIDEAKRPETSVMRTFGPELEETSSD